MAAVSVVLLMNFWTRLEKTFIFFPDADVAFRSLANKIRPTLHPQTTVDVWNPDPQVGERARRLFGRRRVTFHESRASSFQFR